MKLDMGKSDRVCGNGEDNVEMPNFFFPPPDDFSFVPKDMPVPSFMEAIAPIMAVHATAVFAAIQHATKLKQENKSVLDLDKTAAICLYTLEENGIYSPLNRALRDAKDPTQCQQILEPWIKYIRLLSAALDLLPNVSATLYRGIKLDLEASYKSVEGQAVCWPGFTSCTTSMEALSNPKFVGTTGKRTIFAIQCSRGKDIQAFGEAEVLIMATTKFRVTKVDKGDEDLTMVHLVEEEVDCGYPLLNIHLRNAPLCDKHGNELEYVCFDCGDKMACQKCVNTLPCSEHKKRVLLIDGISKYEEEARSNMDKFVDDDWQQDWQHTVDVLNKIIKQAEHVGEQHRVSTQKFFAKLRKQLDEMEKSHLATIDNAAATLTSKRTEIANVVMSMNAGIANVEKLLGDSKDLSRNVVERLNAAKEAKDVSKTYIASLYKLRKQLMKWANYSQIAFINNYNCIGRELKNTINQLSFRYVIVPDNDIAIDTATLNAASRGETNHVKLMELQGPKGLYRVSNDVIAVVEMSRRRVSLISLSTRRIIRSFGQGFLEEPFGICTNSLGHFIVSDHCHSQLFVFDKDDGHLIQLSDPITIDLDAPDGVCFDHKNKRVIVADTANNRVLMLSEGLDTVIASIGGRKGATEGQFIFPSGVGIDSKGRLIVADSANNRIQIFEERDDSSAASGKSFQSALQFGKKGDGDGEFFGYGLLTIDSEDHIIVCDSSNKRIQVFDSDGNFLGCTPTLDLPEAAWGVCLDGRGRMVFSTSGNHDNCNCIWTISKEKESRKRRNDELVSDDSDNKSKLSR